MAVAVDLEKGNLKKKGFIGFSWTTFFFGFFVPLCRGDAKWLIIMLIAGLFSMGISNLIFCFMYNKIYTEGLLRDGFEPVNESDKLTLKSAGLYA